MRDKAVWSLQNTDSLSLQVNVCILVSQSL